ncbi:MAG: SMC-Scp complex subunit ScpB [Rhodospirillales bacterium]|nr:SMC-Scp complex subunit ScpB [Rhodospirillales bacterium]
MNDIETAPQSSDDAPDEGAPAIVTEGEIAAAHAHAHALRVLEAVLFAAAEPLDETAIAARLPKGSDVAALVGELQAQYANRGMNLVRVAGKYTLRTAPDVAGALKIETTVSRKLSRAAVETLAIIAYHQPVTRGEIEEIRAVALSRGTLDTLMEAGWIKPKGHRETPGHPATWVTTEDFLIHFGLDSLKDLPGVDDLKAAGLLDTRPAVSAYSEDGGTLPKSIEESAEEAEAETDGEGADDTDAAQDGIDDLEDNGADEDAETPPRRNGRSAG